VNLLAVALCYGDLTVLYCSLATEEGQVYDWSDGEISGNNIFGGFVLHGGLKW
jgi:hypothetical protein